MTEQQFSYRQIVKATSIFGGVQAFQILIGILRSKVVAILLGASGMGINSLFISTIDLISALTNFGLGTSAVKNMAEAHSDIDTNKSSIIVKVIKRLVWLTGALGALVLFIFADFLSISSFGSGDYTIGLRWLSITLLLNQLTTGESVILRGTRRLKELAKVSLIGSASGLIVSSILYYSFGLNGIVPSIIITSFLTYLITRIEANKIKFNKVNVNNSLIQKQGKDMLFLGSMLSITGIYLLVRNYGVRIYIQHFDSIEQVGYYSAGFTILTTYVGMVFNAMIIDYFPRLSAVASDNNKTKLLINQQAEMSSLILAPILSILIIFIKYFILILFTSEFIVVSEMITFGAIGIYFQSASWSMAFIFLAKGTKRLFLINEIFAGAYSLILQLAGYYLYGLTGLGIGFMLAHILYAIQIFFVSWVKFRFSFTVDYLRLFAINLIIVLTSLLITFVLNNFLLIGLGITLVIFSTIVSYVELDRRINISSIILNRFGKR